MYILGLSCYYHGAAAALVKDGKIVAAAQEERFTRKKHDDCFPANAIKFCLAHEGITSKQLDYVGFYDKPLVKFDRILETLFFIPRRRSGLNVIESPGQNRTPPPQKILRELPALGQTPQEQE